MMAVIPRFDGRIGQSLDTMSATPVGQLYVAPARRSVLEDVGEAIQGVAGQVGKIYQAQQERAAADYTTKTSAEIQEFVIREMEASKRQSLAAGNVDGFTDSFLKKYDEQVNNSLKDAPNDLAREALSHRMMQARNSLLSQAMSFESTARVKIYEGNLDRAADSYAKAAAMDPSQVPQLLKQIDGDIAAATETLGLDNARERSNFYKNQLLSTAASQMMLDNPAGARSFVEQYKDDLSAKNYASLSKSAIVQQRVLENQARKMLEEQQARDAVWGAVNGGIPLNPESAVAQKAVDEAYLTAKAEDPNVDFTNVVERTKILPKSMADDLVATLSSGTPEQQVEAARKITRLHKTVPNLVNKMTATNKARATIIAETVEAGVPPATAVDWATKRTGVIDSQILKSRESAYKKQNLGFRSLESRFTSWFGPGSDSIPPEMRAEGEVLLHGYYVNEGLEPQQAVDNALRDLRGNWHVSNVTGRSRYMKHAPETMYGNEYGSDWIKEQLAADITANFMFDEKPEQTLRRTVLEANPFLRDGKVVYNVYMFNKDTGQLEVLYKPDGEPLLFQPKWEESALYKSLLEKYSGDTTEERYQKYLSDVEEKRMKHELYGQLPVWDWTSIGVEGGF